MRYAKLHVSLALLLVGCCNNTPYYPMYREAPVCALSEAQERALGSCFATADDWLEDEWWHLFKDPQLDVLIQEALDSHPSIMVAEAKVQAANAIRMRTQAPLFPTFDLQGDYTRIRNSKNGIFGLAPQFPLTYTQPEASLSFNLEFDIWKKHANLIAAAVDEVEARAAEAYQSRLILAISVAEAYFEMQALAAREGIARELMRNRTERIRLTNLRKTNGLDNEWSVNRAEIAALAAEQYIQQLSQDVATSRNELLALMAGDFNTQFSLADISSGLREPFPIPETLPLDFLAHRTDVWAYQKRAEAAARLISAARANFYPNVNLLGFAGLQTITPTNFFQATSFYGAVGPAFHLPIFEGGALQAEYNLSQQQYVIAVAEYNEQVLEAVKEVLNALTILQKTGEIHALAVATEQVAFRSLTLAQKRVKNQLSSKLDVLEYEVEWLQTRDNSLQSLLACLEARLFLIRALGGGCERE